MNPMVRSLLIITLVIVASIVIAGYYTYYSIPTKEIEVVRPSIGYTTEYITDGISYGYNTPVGIYFIDDNLTGDTYSISDLSTYNKLKKGGRFTIRYSGFEIKGVVSP